MDGTFDPTYSSNQIWVDTNVNECLTTHLDDSVKKGKAKNDDFQLRITQFYIELEYEEVKNNTNNLYFKYNGSYKSAIRVYKKVSGAWVEQADLPAIFSGGSSGGASNYVYGGSA